MSSRLSAVPTTLLVVFMIVAAACSSAEPDATPASTAPSTTGSPTTLTTDQRVEDTTTTVVTTTLNVGKDEPTVVSARCPFDTPAGTDPDCYTLTVREDRTGATEHTVQIPVAVFPASSGDEKGVPLVYLEGGPGGEILEAVVFAYDSLFAELNRDRTLVLFDQRGTGYAEPSLACPELNELTFELLDDLIEPAELIARQLSALEPCRRRWADEGIDLGQFNSADSAADVADLRMALGYDEWDLYGVSYGTRLALTVMRDHPQGVRSVILDSTYPPEIDGVAFIPEVANRALHELYSACAADDGCASAYGDVETLLFAVIDLLDATPAQIVLNDLFTDDRYDAVLTGSDMLGLVFQALYSEDLIGQIPEMLSDASEGRYVKIERLMSLILANQDFFAIGQNLSVQCHEEVPFSNPERVTAVLSEYPKLSPLVEGAFTQSVFAFEFCAEWGAGVSDPIESKPVTSDIPTLVVGGQFDPITPPAFGRAVAERLSFGQFVEYPALGHGVAVSDGCPLSITLAFLSDPMSTVDSSCVASMPSTTFSVFSLSAEVPLTRVLVDIGGLTVTTDVPQGWEDGGFGAFYRSPSGADETSVVVQAFEGVDVADPLIAAYGSQLSESGELTERNPVTINGRVWRRFSTNAFGLAVEVGIHVADGVTLSVVLICDPREAESYTNSVFLPALASIQVED
jgi:pimeloyl-ACP methyl ester carboxylesterase